MQKVFNIDQHQVPCTMYGDYLWVPDHMMKEEGITSLLSYADKLLRSMDRLAVSHPWIVGSFRSDILGRPRTASQSHLRGLAIDIAPMYDGDSVLSPDRSSLALAWNLVDIAILSTIQFRDAAWVVEGDHIHIQHSKRPELLPLNVVATVPTLSTWYPLAKQLKVGPARARALFGQPAFWTWSGTQMVPSTMTGSSASDKDWLLKYLS